MEHDVVYQVQRRYFDAPETRRWEPVINIDPNDLELAKTLYGREQRIHEKHGTYELRLVKMIEVIEVIPT